MGAGNYGTVLKMTHRETDTQMAVKVREEEEERKRGFLNNMKSWIREYYYGD